MDGWIRLHVDTVPWNFAHSHHVHIEGGDHSIPILSMKSTMRVVSDAVVLVNI